MKRAAFLAVFLAAALLVGRLLGRSPVEVELAYRLAPSLRAIQELDVRFVRTTDDLEVRRVAFRYGPSGAPAEQIHRTRLAPGAYRVELDLAAAGAATRTLQRRLEIGGSGEHITLDLGL